MSEATEDTHPESIAGMRKAIEKNTALCESALAWSVKTYHLVQPVAERQARAQRDSRIAVWAAALAVAASFVGLACGLIR